jgi:DNA (cytosine-5)-methyltransferase 1
MRHVDLCSGIGGFALGFEWAGLSRPVLFCDIEPWSRKVLHKHWPDVPIAEDVKELSDDPDGLIPECDILTAGYPCQPFSLAGERRGTEDDRHIWPYILSIVKAKRPAWCVFENVYGHVSMGLDEVLSDLEGEGYAARPYIVPACAADAPHRRDRVWIIGRNVADAISTGGQARDRDGMGDDHRSCGNQEQSARPGSEINVANPDSTGQQQGHEEMARRPSEQPDGSGVQPREAVAYTECIERQRGGAGSVLRERDVQAQSGRGSQDAQVRWAVEPAVGRVANGIPRRVDRLRGLGNAIVPQIAMRIGMTIKETEGIV